MKPRCQKGLNAVYTFIVVAALYPGLLLLVGLFVSLLSCRPS